jgi:hypothetical protein
MKLKLQLSAGYYLRFSHLPTGGRSLTVTVLCGVRTKSNKLR